jgi:hypothetical protein
LVRWLVGNLGWRVRGSDEPTGDGTLEDTFGAGGVSIGLPVGRGGLDGVAVELVGWFRVTGRVG